MMRQFIIMNSNPVVTTTCAYVFTARRFAAKAALPAGALGSCHTATESWMRVRPAPKRLFGVSGSVRSPRTLPGH